MFFRFFIYLTIVFVSCAHLDASKVNLTYKNEQVLKHGLELEGVTVGGLSGLTYDRNTKYFYAISDDKKNHRVYKLSLETKPEYQFKIEDVIFLKSPNKNRLDRNMDPEALVFYNKDTVFITSEGQQVFKTHEPTQIFNFDSSTFTLKSVWPVEPVFWPANQKKQTGEMGHQGNKGFESLTLDKVRDRLWTVTEMPLFQDLKTQKQAVLRLTEFDIKTQKMLSQFLYPLKHSKVGVTSLYFLKDKTFLSLERNFHNFLFSIEVFYVDCNNADNVKAQLRLKGNHNICIKKKLWSSSELGFLVDNLEGLTLVPIKGSNKQILILISDNNFRAIQKSQILFFEISQ